MGAQDDETYGMKGAYGKRGGRERRVSKKAMHAFFHLPRRFVGECHGKDAVGRGYAARDDVRDAVREYHGFT